MDDNNQTPQGTSAMPQGTASMPQGTASMPQGTASMPQGTASMPQGTASMPDGGSAPSKGGPEIPHARKSHNPGEKITVGGKEYTVEKVIGRGTEGDIYVVSDKKRRYALKLCHTGYKTNTKVLPILSKLNGKGFVADIISFGPDYELLQLLPEGSAASAGLKGNAEAILVIAVNVAMALDAMHRSGVLHKDVKPANILIKSKESWECVLCDFGIADLLDKNGHCMTLQVRTPIYAAPELYATGNTITEGGLTYTELSPKADFYSLGMTILSLWMGESAFLSGERQMAMDKTKGRITVPPDMPDPLAKIVRGLLIKNPDKRWDLDEIVRTLRNEDVPVEEDLIVQDLGIVYNASKHQIANTPEQLAKFMAEDPELAVRYLYGGHVEKWVKPYTELAIEMHDIVEKRFPKDQSTGLMAAIYQLNPAYPFHLSGISRQTGERVEADAVKLKDVGDFCNMAVPDADTAGFICGKAFREWVRVRSKQIAAALPVVKDSESATFMLRVQTVDPLSDINLCNDPQSPDYAMTQEGVGRLLNKVYNIFWNRFEGDFQLLMSKWGTDEYAPLNRQIPAATVANIAVSFLAPERYHYVRDFFDTKGNRFERQRSWYDYCTDRSSDDYLKKCGPKDDTFFSQVAWMKVIKGFGVEPEYEFVDSRHDLKKEYRDRGYRGYLAVKYQENPNADLKPQFAYEKLLHAYLEEVRKIDDKDEAVVRFDSARREADKLLSAGKTSIHTLSVRTVAQYVLTILFAIIPSLLMLAMLVFSIIENPLIDTSGMNLQKFMWVLGGIVAVVVWDAVDFDGCLIPIIAGVLGAVAFTFLVKFLGAFVLYFYAALVLAALVWFLIQLINNRSPFASEARKFEKPGFDEKVLEPLYYAYESDPDKKKEPFDSSLNGAFDHDKIDLWKGDLRYTRKLMFMFIGVVWFLALFSSLIPKSERFGRLSAPIIQKFVPVKYLDTDCIEPGSKGEIVVALQQFLKDNGYVKREPDGDYGPGTEKAVKAFQKANGLPATGIADAETVNLINKMAAEAAKTAPAEPVKAAPEEKPSAAKAAKPAAKAQPAAQNKPAAKAQPKPEAKPAETPKPAASEEKPSAVKEAQTPPASSASISLEQLHELAKKKK